MQCQNVLIICRRILLKLPRLNRLSIESDGSVLLKQHHLSASKRLAKSRRQSIFLRAKPPISPLQASIASATWRVINAFVAYGPQRQLSLDRASRRHGGVEAEQLLACSVLMASLTTAADKSRSIEIPSSQVARFCETSLPQSAPVLTCVSVLCRKTALCVRLELDCPSFANEPLIERGGLAFD